MKIETQQQTEWEPGPIDLKNSPSLRLVINPTTCKPDYEEEQ